MQVKHVKLFSFFLMAGMGGYAAADWKLVKTINDERHGEISIYIDYDKIERKKNLFVPVILNRAKPSPIGAMSDKNLLEIDCAVKKLSQVEGGTFVGPMATGGPASDNFGPLKYEPVPFRSWSDVNGQSPALFREIFKAACSKS
jgi:hypothetical protein